MYRFENRIKASSVMLALMDPKISISQYNLRKSDKNVFANQAGAIK